MKINNREISSTSPVFIIAELSCNHMHNLDIAKKTIIAMKESGADAIKIQTYTPDTITLNCNTEYFQIKQGTIWDGKTLYDLYKEAYTPWEWHAELKELTESLGLVFFSTPYDITAVDFLENLGVQLYKIASFEITDIPLIEYIAKKGKPIIFSTGIATLEDIEEIVKTCEHQNNTDIAILKCTSAYPAPYEEMNLCTIPDLKTRFSTLVGLSDHTLGITMPIASVALGAKIIEKHFILDRTNGGPDASFSLEPEEFKMMVECIRQTEKAIGTLTYDLTAKQKKSREFSRSIFVIKDINEGEKFTKENIKSIRPGFGLAPKYLNKIINKTANTSLKKGTPLSWEVIN